MITRPLDLASRLRREPRSNDWLFFVNGGLIALLFVLAGSQFVLAPSLGVKFRLPESSSARTDARAASHHISVTDTGQIFASDGLLTMAELKRWLGDEMRKLKAAKSAQTPMLLVQMDVGVEAHVFTEITAAAHQSGFEVCLATEDPKASVTHGGR